MTLGSCSVELYSEDVPLNLGDVIRVIILAPTQQANPSNVLIS